MSLTRKEFFRQGILGLGKAAFDIADTLKGANSEVAAAEESGGAPPEPRPDMAATPFNERCLARNCGCFACVERCEPQAIMVVPGEGIRIDTERCTGCGTCEYVCPVVPKAVALVPRDKN